MITMKIFVCFLLLCMVLIILTSCIREEFEWPKEGVWVSDNPAIVMNIPPESEYQARAHGIFIKDGQEIETFISIRAPLNNTLSIFDVADLIPGGGLRGDNPFFSGRYTIDGDRLYLQLHPRWQREHGIDVIVFTRIGDYEGASVEE